MMARLFLCAAAVAGLAACSDGGEKAFTQPLETALKGVDLVRKDLSTPERAIFYHWARQDARAVALCEAMRLRRQSPASYEGRIIAAALATELPYVELYAGELKAHLDYAATPPAQDCREVAERYERRLVGVPTRDGSGAAIVTAQIRNIVPLAQGVSAPSKATEDARVQGRMYRYTFRQDGADWKLHRIEERPNYNSGFRVIMDQADQGYPLETPPF